MIEAAGTVLVAIYGLLGLGVVVLLIVLAVNRRGRPRDGGT